MIAELVSVLAVLAGGSLLVRAAGLTGWSVPAFGLVAGVCVQLTVGLVQVVTPLPTTPVLTLALTAGLPALWWAVRWWRGHDVGLPVRWTALVLAAVAGGVLVLRAANLVKWHTDSLRYLMTGTLLADGTYYSGVSTHNITKRLIGVPLLHAPAQLSGEQYLRAITPLLAVATVAIVVWLFRQGMRDRIDPTQLAVFAVLGGLLLVTGNRFVFSAFYLNGHLLFAVLLLVVAGAGWLLLTGVLTGADRLAPALRLLQLLALPAMVVTRPEGSLMAAVALLPMLLSTRVRVPHRAAALATLGVSTMVWQGFVLWVHRERGEAVPATVAAMLALGLLLLALSAGLLRWETRLSRADRLPSRPDRLLWVAEAGLWLALAGFALRDPAILVDSVDATIQNVVFGDGKWGSSLVALGLLVLGAVTFLRAPGAASLRFPVTTFIPLAFLLAYLRDAAYRVGYGDSLSRMFMHIVPLAVLFVMVTYSRTDWSSLWTRLGSSTEGSERRGVAG
ncbi:MAG: hypothetical protein GEV12_13370 [Micromonosporaceae bacterium]|nr:hypothetical protein [Micromonosporaceae bacterium]